ncbi:class I SAM-dependent RNA methyltransferase [uncultured Jannaschia sp.]|uniref:class I SAM-dependent RNA methyltransferase n=1 Tax=uncultured Jannaschia sp. TaxID=293347 RepID=UPI002601FEE7|nr:class I SAM-dependent RNA methyltransferase [uncultured Jannaschia sp.]
MTLTITRLGHHGDGIATGEDGPIYVARSLPGEVVTGDVEGDRLSAPRIVTPSPDRVSAPCPHARRCGGCAVQHASDAFVATWKADLVRAALARAGLEAEIASVETSPSRSRRRATLSARRTRKGAEIGFHIRGSAEIVAIPDCRVLSPALLARLPQLEALARIAAPRGVEVALQMTETAAGVDLSVTGARDLDRDLLAALAEQGHGFVRITWNGEPAVQQDTPWVALGRARVTPPPGAFLQATAAGEAALTARVTEILGGAQRVVDLFAGCGTFTFPLAETAAVHAVEGDRPALASLLAAARATPGLRPVTGAVRDLFREPLRPDELEGFDAAVIDPPRAGAAAQMAQIAASGLRRVAVVSCDPGTFARDAATLAKAGFRMGPITVVDQFRWSPHIELVTSFER